MKEPFIQEENAGLANWDYGKVYVQHSSTTDAFHISRNLREADRNELSALTRKPYVQLLRDGIKQSDPCYTVFIRKTSKPCAVFGTRDSGYTNSGVVWLLGTDDLFSIGFTFLRKSNEWVNELHTHYRLLYNVIDARNKVHIRWLKWLGFDFIKDIPKYGIERRKFRLFRRYV